MSTFIKIHTKGNNTVYLNITQIVKLEATLDGGTKISMSNTDLIESSRTLEDILKLVKVK
jgi:hypothetical protein